MNVRSACPDDMGAGSGGFGATQPHQQQNNAFGARPSFGVSGSTFGSANSEEPSAR